MSALGIGLRFKDSEERSPGPVKYSEDATSPRVCSRAHTFGIRHHQRIAENLTFPGPGSYDAAHSYTNSPRSMPFGRGAKRFELVNSASPVRALCMVV